MRGIRVLVLAGLLSGLLAVAGTAGGAQGPTCFGRPADIIARPGVTTFGTSGADVIIGTSGDDVIRARGGNDRVCAKGGDDRVYGHGGNDMINLGSGDDVGRGGKGKDLIRAKKGRDIVWGNSGNDELNGGAGFDMLNGGKGHDDLLGKSGADSLEGNSGDDTVRGGKGIDACRGGSGVNTLSSCNEMVPFGPNPFVGWWKAIDADGSNLIFTIDPAGRWVGFDDATRICGNLGFPGAAASWSATGTQTSATNFAINAGGTVTCHPVGQAPVQGPLNLAGNYVYAPASDTITLDLDGTCHWRRGSSRRDCT